MKSFELSDAEIDLVRHCLLLFKKDLNFDSVTFARCGNLDSLQQCVNSLSTIEFLLNKIKF